MSKGKRSVRLIILMLVFALASTAFYGCGGGTATILSIKIAEGFKSDYIVGDLLSLDGAKLQVKQSDETSSEVEITSNMVSGFDSSSVGTRTMLISYGGHYAPHNYTVSNASEKVVRGIEVKNGTLKKVYLKDEILTLTGAKLIVTYDDSSSEEVAITEDLISGFDSSAVKEDRTMLISYGEKVIGFYYSVIAKAITLAKPKLTLNGSVLKWTAAPHATSYEIYIDGAIKDTITVSEYKLTFEQFGDYRVAVKAKGSGTVVLDSELSQELVYKYYDFAVNDISVEYGGKLSWSVCNGATGYIVDIDGVEHTVSQPEFTPSGLVEGKSYTVRVRAIHKSGEGELGNPFVFRTLHTPTNLTAKDDYAGKKVILTWDSEEVAPFDSYSVYVNGTVHTTASNTRESHLQFSGLASFEDKTNLIYLRAVEGLDTVALGESNEAEFRSILRLQEPKNIRVEGGLIHWDAAGSENEYAVDSGSGFQSTSSQSFDCSQLGGGAHRITIKSVAVTPYEVDSAAASFTFTKLNMPIGVKLIDGRAQWNISDKNLKYEVSIRNDDNSFQETFITGATEYDLQSSIDALTTGNYTIGVRAKTNYAYQSTMDSNYAGNIRIMVLEKLNFSMRGQYLDWDAVSGSSGYDVKIGNGEVIDKGTSTTVDLSGITAGTTIEVTPRDMTTTIIKSGKVEVVVVAFNPLGGYCNESKRILLKGDEIGELPTAQNSGVVAEGWLTEESGGETVTAETVVNQDITVFAYYNPFTFDLSGETAKLTKFNGRQVGSTVVIPSSVSGKNVASIEAGVFENCNNITSLTIPGSVTSVGHGALKPFVNLASLSLPSVSMLVTDSPFGGVGIARLFDKSAPQSLTTVELTNETELPRDAFYNCASITNIKINEGVTSIGSSAFGGCSNLKSITIPNSVTSIGSSAFSGCSGLTSITIPSSVASIGSDAFEGTAWYNAKADGVVYIGAILYAYKGEMPQNTSIEIKAGTATISPYAFYGCTGLTSVTIPSSVTSIESSAFRSCSGLTSVTIPNSVVSIESSAFSGCSGLTSVTIPNSVTSIGHYALFGCSNLKSITIPNSVTSIGGSAFSGCSGLTSVTIPNSVTSIESSAFEGCGGLTSVTIPNSVTSIESSAFRGCSGLTSITIPSGVTSIESFAFEGCSGLTSITIPSGVTSIGEYAFRGCSNLKSITIPNSVTSIESYAFSRCSGLTSVTIPGSVTSIGGSAFSGCSGLTSITIPSSVTSIGHYAFSGCSGLTSITIPNSVTRILDYAFRGCSNLKSITIPSSVTSIGEGAFYECSSLTSITIQSSATSIGYDAFAGTAWYNAQADGVVYIGSVLYSYKGEMPQNASINIKAGTVSISTNAFYNCSGLTSITIPNSVTSIGNYAFRGCPDLTIYCQAESQPSGWDYYWNDDGRPVIWNHKLS